MALVAVAFVLSSPLPPTPLALDHAEPRWYTSEPSTAENVQFPTLDAIPVVSARSNSSLALTWSAQRTSLPPAVDVLFLIILGVLSVLPFVISYVLLGGQGARSGCFCWTAAAMYEGKESTATGTTTSTTTKDNEVAGKRVDSNGHDPIDHSSGKDDENGAQDYGNVPSPSHPTMSWLSWMIGSWIQVFRRSEERARSQSPLTFADLEPLWREDGMDERVARLEAKWTERVREWRLAIKDDLKDKSNGTKEEPHLFKFVLFESLPTLFVILILDSTLTVLLLAQGLLVYGLTNSITKIPCATSLHFTLPHPVRVFASPRLTRIPYATRCNHHAHTPLAWLISKVKPHRSRFIHTLMCLMRCSPSVAGWTCPTC